MAPDNRLPLQGGAKSKKQQHKSPLAITSNASEFEGEAKPRTNPFLPKSSQQTGVSANLTLNLAASVGEAPQSISSRSPASESKSDTALMQSSDKKEVASLNDLRRQAQYLQPFARRQLASRRRALNEIENYYRRKPASKRAATYYTIRRLVWQAKHRPQKRFIMDLSNRLNRSPSPEEDYDPMSPMSPKESTTESTKDSVTKDNDLVMTSPCISTDDSSEKSSGREESAESESTNITTPDASESENKVIVGKRKREADGSNTQTSSQKPATSSQASTKEIGEVTAAPERTIKEAKKSISTKSSDQQAEPVCSGALGSSTKKALDSEQRKKKKSTLTDENDSAQPKSKKLKTESSTPAATSASPATQKAKVAPTKLTEYHDLRVHDMLTHPLTFDDLVYEDTRPMHKRKKWRKCYPKRGPFDMTMSGGLGATDAQFAKSKARSADGKLSKKVLKKSHDKKVAEHIQGMKAEASKKIEGPKVNKFLLKGTGVDKNKKFRPSASSQKYNHSRYYSEVPNLTDRPATPENEDPHEDTNRSHAARQESSGFTQASFEYVPESPSSSKTVGVDKTPEKRLRSGSDKKAVKISSPIPTDKTNQPSSPADIFKKKDMPTPDRAWFKQDFEVSYEIIIVHTVDSKTDILK